MVDYVLALSELEVVDLCRGLGPLEAVVVRKEHPLLHNFKSKIHQTFFY